MTSLSQTQRNYFEPGLAGQFRMSIIVVMDALWCRANLLSFILPKVKVAVADSTLFTFVRSLNCFKAQYEEYENQHRLVITSDKLCYLTGKFSQYLRKPRSVTQSQLEELIQEAHAFEK